MKSNDNRQLRFMLAVTYKLWIKVDSCIFHDPVDTVKWNIPHYCEMIKHPMDMGTIKARLNKKQSFITFSWFLTSVSSSVAPLIPAAFVCTSSSKQIYPVSVQSDLIEGEVFVDQFL